MSGMHIEIREQSDGQWHITPVYDNGEIFNHAYNSAAGAREGWATFVQRLSESLPYDQLTVTLVPYAARG